MKKTRLIILFSILGVLVLLYFIYSNPNEKQYQWSENYKTSSDQPYGTRFIKELLQAYRPGEHFVLNDKKPLHKLLDSASTKPIDYVFIGQNLYLDDADKEALLNFIHAGNDAFVASTYLPYDLIDAIYNKECEAELFYETQEVKSVTLNFYHPTIQTKKGYTYSYRYGAKDSPYFWNNVTSDIFCDSLRSVIPLGYQQPNKVNFFKLPYGNGNLYVHSNPLVFTNYFISKRDKTEYAGAVFSHLQGKSIIWDEFSKAKFTSNNTPYNSPLSFILQHASLKYAWWMMLASAVLYTFFAAKRTQRVIPVLQEKANTSLEFINMIAALHFQNGNHLDIARKKVKYFLYFIRAKYGVYAHDFTEAHFKRLAEKSKVDESQIKIIFDEITQMERHVHYNENKLISLYTAIDKFYKHCK